MSKKKGASGGLMPGGNFLKLVPLDYIFAALCTGFCFSSFITLLTKFG